MASTAPTVFAARVEGAATEELDWRLVTNGSLSAVQLGSFLDVLAEVEDKIECVVTSALCDLSTCSLNSDKLTASCGCLAMPADTGNPAALQLGWTSAILAGNPLYRTAVDSCHKGECSATSSARDTLCQEIKAAQMWPALSSVSSHHSLSFWSYDPLWDTAWGLGPNATHKSDHGSFTCDTDTMRASCMAAPCYDVTYGAAPWNLTCVCPVSAGSCRFEKVLPDRDAGLCDELTAVEGERACAASCWDFTQSYDAASLQLMIDAIEAADPTTEDSAYYPDATTCQPYGTRETIEHEWNATSNVLVGTTPEPSAAPAAPAPAPASARLTTARDLERD